MKILMIHPHDIFSLQEPWTVRIVSLARELSRRAHQVKIVYFRLDNNSQERSLDADRIATITLSRKAGMVTLISNIYRVCKLADWADIIHFQKCFHWASIPALFAGYLKRKPLHYDWDDWEEKIFVVSNKKSFFPAVLLLRVLERWLPQMVDTVSVASDQLKRLCLNSGVEESKIFKLPVGVDLGLFNANHSGHRIRRQYQLKQPVVFYHGQLHGAQYASLFLQAARIVSQNNPRVNFLLVGGGYQLQSLRGLAEELGLGNVTFTGAKPHYEIPEYIGCADICVACFEQNEITQCKSPLKIMEYLASGKAVIVSEVGEVRNMVQDAAVIVPPNNVQAIAREILRLLENEQPRKDLAKRARRHAEQNCAWGLKVDNLEKAYESCLCYS